MSRLNSYELTSKDIDLFCYINNHPVHIASLGHMIPVILRDRYKIQDNREIVLNLRYSTECHLNFQGLTTYIREQYVESPLMTIPEITQRIQELPSAEYLQEYPLWLRMFSWSFVDIARRGFYSFACLENKQFLLVASPCNMLNPIPFDLPCLNDVNYNFKIEETSNLLIL